MTVKIITDGSADLPKDLATALNIKVVPLTVQFEDAVMSSDIENSEFYDRMKKSAVLPKTSSPSPHQFYEAMKEQGEHEHVLVLTLTSQLSSTHQHALMARDMLLEEGNKTRVEVIDSKTASAGLGLIALHAAKLAGQRMPLDQIKTFVIEQIKQTRTHFFLDTLENVIKGGRLDKVKGKIASMLNIKLLMRASEEGQIEVMDKFRGTQNAIKRMVEKIGEKKIDFEKAVLAIAHSNDESKAQQVLEMIKSKYPFKEVVFSEMGPVIGTYAGEGGILIAY
ncbi:DegV family protein [Marinicrinis lubricantis]|uniref:DegV family protein n=1 Tax=Marinicrinis lubricantis TaxID=2086470 RepID=A0ABW1ILA8_9BACL